MGLVNNVQKHICRASLCVKPTDMVQVCDHFFLHTPALCIRMVDDRMISKVMYLVFVCSLCIISIKTFKQKLFKNFNNRNL